MKPETLKVLKDFSRSMGDFLWILDENWQIIWGTCVYDCEKDIPEFLQVPRDSWEDAKKEVYWNASRFVGELACYREYNGRILVMRPTSSSEKIFRTLCQIFPKTTQVLNGFTDKLEYEHHKKNFWNQDHLLHRMRSIYRVQNRIPYMQQLLDRANFKTEREVLWIRSELQEIIRNIGEILRCQTEFRIDQQLVDITVDETQQNITGNVQTEFLYENRKFFCVSILSSFLLCCHDPKLKQHVRMDLNHNLQDKEIEILVAITAKNQNSGTIFADMLTDPANMTEELPMEKEFLNVFCSMHMGKWELHQNKNEEFSTNLCKIVIKTAEFGNLEFHRSRNENYAIEFSNVCEMILAEFYSKKES
ncbi:MAG: hypothetical protein K2G25_02235 [Oscillospiraceae bacterium]|nr:hypothetical protein [Oscillospiraceae bacterium]